MPAFWGNQEVCEKVNYIENRKNLNTVFIGSSKIKRQIIPGIFDSVTQNKTASFNLGCNGLFIPESFQLIDFLMDSTSIKNIIFEVRPLYHIYPENLHITRTIYYHTWSSYFETINNAINANLPLSRKINVYTTFSIAQVENLFNFNFINGYIDFKNYNFGQSNNNLDVSGGYVSMGDSASENLKKDSAELGERAYLSKQYLKKYYADSMGNLKPNKFYLSALKRLIKKSHNKNVHLVLLFPSALREFEYREVLPILNRLKSEPIIILSGADNYPEFYDVENNYETEHLNTRGSYKFSVALGLAYNKLGYN